MVQVHSQSCSPPSARIVAADSLPKFHITTTPVTDDPKQIGKNESKCVPPSVSSSTSGSGSPEHLLVDSDSSGSHSSRNSVVCETYPSGNELSPVSASGSDHSHADSTTSSSLSEPPGKPKDHETVTPDASTTGPPSASDITTSPSSSSRKSSVHFNSAGVPIEKKHICDVCGKAFPYLSILESHKRCHTGEKPFACRFCDKKFAQKATLQVHERTHTGERPYKCKYCEKTFAQYGTKTVHEKSAHLGIRNYKCPKCSKCLSSPSALYTHKKTHGEKVFQCEFCPKTFTLKNYLKLHVKQVHEQNERKHICHFCNKSFAYAGSLQVHVRTHTGERPYVCKYCPKAFASQGNLQSHERTHTGERPYSCQHCGRSFIQKSQLTAHEATHMYSIGRASPSSGDPQRKQNDYVCKFCGKRYAYASSLCNFCDKSFTNQGNMQVHQRVHTGERPYKCEACGKSYAQKVGLKIHQEQCQTYLNRRGSVMTVGTNESESSPSADEHGDDVIQIEPIVDDDEQKSGRYSIITGPLKPRPILPTNPSSVFSSPIHSQRGSFSSEIFAHIPSSGTTFDQHGMPQQYLLHSLKLPTLSAGSSATSYPLSPALSHTTASSSATMQSPTSYGVNNGFVSGGPSAFHELLSSQQCNASMTSSEKIPLLHSSSSMPQQLPSMEPPATSALTSLLLEQLDPQYGAQMTALRALIDLAAGGSSAPVPQSPMPLVPQLSQLINSQLQQQILNQLLLQNYGSGNASVPNSQQTPAMFNDGRNGGFPQLGSAPANHHPGQLPSSSFSLQPSNIALQGDQATGMPSTASILAAIRDIAKPEMA
ncbi:zinc finger protein [Aphelenchoides avenae]|nr:zinc finger protein [Aphelenchus avenae]